MKDAVSRYNKFLESMVLTQVDDALALQKFAEVTRDGLGEVAHEVTCMSWVREHVPESEASNHTYVKLVGGDHFKSVCLEEVPRANGRGTNSVAYLNVSKYGGRGTTSCTETRVSQDYMAQILRRTAGRDAALCFTSTQLAGELSEVEIQVTPDGDRVPPVPVPAVRAKAKAVPKPKARGKAVAKPVPKGRAMRVGLAVRVPMKAMKAMKAMRVPMK